MTTSEYTSTHGDDWGSLILRNQHWEWLKTPRIWNLWMKPMKSSMNSDIFQRCQKSSKNPIEISLQLQNYGFNELQWEPPLISQVWARASGSWIASLPSVAPPVDEVDPDCLGGGDWDNWWLVGGFKHLLFSHNIWDNPSHWLIFFRGSWNHQPGIIVNDYGLFHGLFPHSLLIKHQ